jgi:hypothetical protein
LYGETAVLSFSAGGIAGFLKTSRVARVVGYLEKRKGGAKFVLMSFVHAARNPRPGLSSAAGHMTGGDVVFKALAALIPPNDE